MADDKEAVWLPVIGRSLALLAMHKAELGEKDLVVKAEFLQALGVPRADVASMLGSTAESLRVMIHQRKKGGRNRRGNKKKG